MLLSASGVVGSHQHLPEMGMGLLQNVGCPSRLWMHSSIGLASHLCLQTLKMMASI